MREGSQRLLGRMLGPQRGEEEEAVFGDMPWSRAGALLCLLDIESCEPISVLIGQSGLMMGFLFLVAKSNLSTSSFLKHI